jgi:D-alanyl-D-alanine carboxypeptidase
MILDIPKLSKIKNNTIKLGLLIVLILTTVQTTPYFAPPSIAFIKRADAITTPYSPSIDILNASSTEKHTPLNNSSSSIIQINAVKVWQENGDFSRTLKKGSRGNDVIVLQIILKSLTNDKTRNSANGYFGPNTYNNLRTVQAKLNLPITGELDSDTRLAINNLMFKELCPTAIRVIGQDNMVESDFDKVFENLNRSKSIPLDYIPQDLVRVPNSIKTVGVMCVSDRIMRHLNEMIGDAKKQKLDIAVTSSYRSADMQKFLYSMWINKRGNAAKAGIAEAGHSEHQLGTTIDVSGKSIGFAGVSPSFANSKEGKWMAQNSYKYGFIMSYPDKKQKETGYIYEPWHFRYIGVDNANDIFTEKLTIQDFLNFSNATTSNTTSTSNTTEDVDPKTPTSTPSLSF